MNFAQKLFLLSPLFLMLAGCDQPRSAKETVTTDNPDYRAERLFTENGCNIYRFTDNGKYHYFVDCRGKIISYYDEHVGKTVVRRRDDIDTVTEPAQPKP